MAVFEVQTQPVWLVRCALYQSQEALTFRVLAKHSDSPGSQPGHRQIPPQFDSTVQSPHLYLLQVWFVSTPNIPVVGVAFFVFPELLAPIF